MLTCFEHLFDGDVTLVIHLAGHVKNKVCSNNYSRTKKLKISFRTQCLQFHQLGFDLH
jgi:hypothetical protein